MWSRALGAAEGDPVAPMGVKDDATQWAMEMEAVMPSSVVMWSDAISPSGMESVREKKMTRKK